MRSVVVFFLVVVAVAAIASFCTVRCMTARTASEAEGHKWLHKELALTPTENAALKPIELKFAEHERNLREQLREADQDLAKAIAEDKAYTPRVAAAVEMVHHRMGDLQKATIEHVFAMRSVLTPEQGDTLLRLTEEGLLANP